MFKGALKAKNIKVTSVLGGVWKLQAPAAFGIFKFLQVESISALSFFYRTQGTLGSGLWVLIPTTDTENTFC